MNDPGPMGDDAPAPEQGQAPWLFRHRGSTIGAAFLLALLLTNFLKDAWPASGLDAFLALPRNLRIDSDGGTGPVWPIAIPMLLVMGCFALRASGTSYLRGHVMSDSALHAERLIVAGSFRWVRNPLYLGNLLLAAAFGLFLPPPGLIVTVALQAIVVAALARLEADALRARHGVAYETYAKQVHAFLPKRPGPAVPDADIQPDWRNGLLTESWHLGFALSLAGLGLHVSGLSLAGFVLVVASLLRNSVANRKARHEAPAARL